MLAFSLASDSAQSRSETLLRGMIHSEEGIELFFRVEGEGADTIVVLHGGSGLSSESLRPDLGFLSRDFHLVFL